MMQDFSKNLALLLVAVLSPKSLRKPVFQRLWSHRALIVSAKYGCKIV